MIYTVGTKTPIARNGVSRGMRGKDQNGLPAHLMAFFVLRDGLSKPNHSAQSASV